MGKKVKVAAIQIQYPDGEVKQVSIEDARELHRQLEELFGVTVVNVPSSPVVIERDSWKRWQPMWDHSKPVIRDPMPHEAPQIWCCEQTATSSSHT